MNLRAHFFLTAFLTISLPAAEETTPKDGPLLIQECSSGIDYPDKGDEKLAVDHGGLTFHVKILHPDILGNGMHFSTPFFWVSGKEAEVQWPPVVTVKTHVDGLSWNSAQRAYFFAEKEAKDGKGLRGFLLENGYDNWDSGCQGLLFLYDGENKTAWSWSHGFKEPGQKFQFRVFAADDPKKAMPEDLSKRITQVLLHAEKKAGGWTGP